MLNEKLTKDMANHRLIKTGTANGWTYRLYGDKWIEAYCDVTFPAGTGPTLVNAPFKMGDYKYQVRIQPTTNGLSLSQYGLFADGQADGRKYLDAFYIYRNSSYSSYFSLSLTGYIE